jgi:nicotinamidase-related amidase
MHPVGRPRLQQPRPGYFSFVRDCLLLVDLFSDFAHEDGEVLLGCFRERFPRVEKLVAGFRGDGPIIYANDSFGVFDGAAAAIVDRARRGTGGPLVDPISPRPGDRFVVKPRYSAFDLTPLSLILHELAIERVILSGMSTEGCVTQTAIDAREAGLKVSVVAPACCTVDLELEEIALGYLARVVGAQIVG